MVFHHKIIERLTQCLIIIKRNKMIERRHNNAGPTTWFCMGMTWDRSVPFAACYLYAPAVLPFTTIYSGAPELGMEEWGDNPVDDFNHMLLAGSNSNQEWIGCGAHIAYWAGRVLSAAEMRRVMVP